MKLAMEYAKLKQYQLAEKAGIKQPSLSHLINDPNVTGSEFTVQLSIACGVRPEWLAMEQGEMVDGLYVEDPKAKAVLLAMQQMPEYKKDMLVTASHSLAEQPDQGATGTE